MNILITGGSGFIARNLSKYLSKMNYNVECVSRKELDLIDNTAVKIFFKDKYYDLIIHTAIEGGRRTEPDTEKMFYNNILMIYNILSNKSNFKKIIVFGSGAELDRRFDINTETNIKERYPIDYYGMSKNIISKLCLVEPNMYNFRIFNCFGVDELKDRLIRSNIERNIRGEPMILFSNRLMDFFYVEDLSIMIQFFLKNPNNFPKTIDCVYRDKYTLLNILEIINEISENPVEILYKKDESTNKINSTDKDYVGIFTDLSANFIGIEKSIETIYNELRRVI